MNSKIPMYTMHTSSHEVLFNDWFMPTFQENDFDLVSTKYNDETNGIYQSSNWIKSVTKKLDLLIQAAKDNMDKIFMYSDVDIQFFKPFKEILVKDFVASGLDFLSQRDFLDHCTGFFITRGSDLLIDTLHDTKDLMKTRTMDDQCGFNIAIKYTKLKCAFLKNDYFNVGDVLKKKIHPCLGWNWTDTIEILNEDVPENIIMHHGNWTRNINDKIKLMTLVKSIVHNRKAG